MEQIINEFIAALKQNYIDAGKVATGNLVNNISGTIEQNGTTYSVVLHLPKEAEYIEYGRRPGKFPPIEAIREWIRVKPVLPQPRSGHLPTPNQLAYAIAKKIADRGIEPQPIIKSTVNSFDLAGKVENEIAKQLFNRILKA